MKQKFIYSLIVSFITTCFFSLLFLNGFFISWQNKLADTLFLAQKSFTNIVLITIDNKSIQSIGRFPWNRSVYARLLAVLGSKPAAIGIDIAFPEKSTGREDTLFASELTKHANVVLPIEMNNPIIKDSFIDADSLQLPIQQLQDVAKLGVVNTIPDDDGITRETPMNIRVHGKRYANFSLSLLQIYYKNDTTKLKQLSQIPLNRGLMRINFASTQNTFDKYSFIDIIRGKISANVFTNKIVLIGATAPDLHDTQLTPISNGTPMSGVEIHANTLQTIESQRFLQSETPITTISTILFLSACLLFIFTFFSLMPATGLSILFFVIFIIYIFFSFDHGTIRNIVYPILSILVTYILQLIYNYFIENRNRRYLRRAFSYYVSETVLEEILSTPAKLTLGGAKKNISVLFSDIAGFTTIAEELKPEALTKLLNEYLTEMTKIVFKNRGVLDKYIGDAVMAFWGAPIYEKEHAYLACKTALEMQEAIKELQKDWPTNKNAVRFQVRIGINTGDMVVGNMGSETRFDYTLIGDNVNLGSRLEGINKIYGTSIIISETTYKQLEQKVIVRFLDTVIVKGKSKGMGIYELRGLGTPDDKEAEFLHEFEISRKLYEKGEFKKALPGFQAVQKYNVNDTVTNLYIIRCSELIKNPAKIWDGIYQATSK